MKLNGKRLYPSNSVKYIMKGGDSVIKGQEFIMNGRDFYVDV